MWSTGPSHHEGGDGEDGGKVTFGRLGCRLCRAWSFKVFWNAEGKG
jgi:hypothetical protein